MYKEEYVGCCMYKEDGHRGNYLSCVQWNLVFIDEICM